jgi:hypothetical protein
VELIPGSTYTITGMVIAEEQVRTMKIKGGVIV